MARKHPIVGVWRVKTVGAPFAYHMFAFHADGTMHQTNPPLGNTETSDTAGLGIWADHDGQAVKARFEEFRLAHADGTTVTHGAVDFTLKVVGDELLGECEFNIFDPENGTRLKGPLKATLTGQRVVLA